MMIGRFFKTEEALIAYLKSEEKKKRKAGIVVTQKYYDQFKVVAGANGLLLTGEKYE
jgi:hypothetical protein